MLFPIPGNKSFTSHLFLKKLGTGWSGGKYGYVANIKNVGLNPPMQQTGNTSILPVYLTELLKVKFSKSCG